MTHDIDLAGDVVDELPAEQQAASEVTRDDLHERPRWAVEEAARKWFGVATDMRNQRDEIALDLEMALNLCRNYQDAMSRLDVPDPNLARVRSLLIKYGMEFIQKPKQSFRIFVDGVDITTYPDSIPADAEELHLTGEEYYGIETVELVQVESGEIKFLPAGQPPVVPEDVEWVAEAEVVDAEIVSPETRDWLIEEVDAQTERINAQSDDPIYPYERPLPDSEHPVDV